MRGVYVLTMHAVSTDSAASTDANGAYVNVYAAAPSEAEARRTALKELASAGWRCLTVESVSLHTREDYATDSAGLEYFEQALTDRIVLVAHTYPREH